MTTGRGIRMLALAAGGAAMIGGGSASAQDVVLRLVSTQDYSTLDDDLLPDGVTPNPNQIGSFISAIALAGDRLFVGGFENNGVTRELRVVQISDIYGSRTRSNLPTSLPTEPFSDGLLIPAFRQVIGFDYAPGWGLLMGVDQGTLNTNRSVFRWDVDSGPSPVLVARGRPGAGRSVPSVSGGVAWDFGFDGAGFDFTGTPESDGPIAAAMDFRLAGGARGPVGLLPRDTPEGLAFNGNQRVYDWQTGGPEISQFRVDAEGESLPGSLWQDIDIDPTDGTIAVRVSNSVGIFERRGGNGTGTFNAILREVNDIFMNLQTIQLVHGSEAGSFILFNDRLDFGGPPRTLDAFTVAMRYDGTPMSVAWQQADGSPLVFTRETPGWIDYSWDPTSGRLAISEGATGVVRIFEVLGPPTGCPCAADYDGSGGTPDGSDIAAFFADWIGGEGGADVDCSGGTPDGTDIDVFFGQWLEGGC